MVSKSGTQNNSKNMNGHYFFTAIKNNLEVAYFILGVFAIYLLHFYSYLIFHSLAEMFFISISFATFILVWLSRRFLENNFFLFLGVSLLFVSFFDIIHLFAYKGMGVFTDFDANLPTQLWIIARYVQALSFLIAPFFINRKISLGWTFSGYIAFSLIIFASVFYWRNFPDCYIEGQGLTQFKIISEYVISLIFVASAAFLFAKKTAFSRAVFRFLIVAILITILAEQSFTQYISVYGFFNLLGHILKIIATYFLYKAIIVVGIKNPEEVFYRKLKQSEQGLREAEIRYRMLFERTPVGVVIFDTKTTLPIEFNVTAYRQLGYTAEEFAKLKISDYESQESPEDIKKHIEKVLNVGRDDFETKHRAKSGEIRDVFVTVQNIDLGAKRVIFAIFNDITDLRKAEQELKNRFDELAIAKAKNEAVLLSMADGVVVTDNNMKVVLMNRTAQAISGWSESEALGKIWPELIVLQSEKGEKVPPERSPVGKAINEETTINAIYLYTRKNKTRFPVAITSSPIIWGAETIGAVIIFRDITRERAVDKAKSEFISVASHQLKTPLTAISWITERLLGSRVGKLSQKQKDYLSDIYNSNRRMIRLVDDLLSVSRLEEGRIRVEPKLLQIEDIIEGVIKEQKNLIEKCHCRVVFEKPVKKLPLAWLDESLVRQVIYNLLTNAIRYSVPRGRVRVGLEKTSKDFILQVSDNGIGIPKEKQYRVFEKFFRAENAQKKQAEGTGLGLYIDKMILGAMGGRIWFESQENKGTTFYVSLPLEGMKNADGVLAR